MSFGPVTHLDDKNTELTKAELEGTTKGQNPSGKLDQNN